MSLVQTIKIAQKSAGISDDAHRANIRDIKPTANSCTQLNTAQQTKLLLRYKGLGQSPSKTKSKLPPLRAKIYAQWGVLAKCHKVQNDSKQACDAWFKNTFKCSMSSADKRTWFKAVELLKQWIAE